jgi:hypothetical protein
MSRNIDRVWGKKNRGFLGGGEAGKSRDPSPYFWSFPGVRPRLLTICIAGTMVLQHYWAGALGHGLWESLGGLDWPFKYKDVFFIVAAVLIRRNSVDA